MSRRASIVVVTLLAIGGGALSAQEPAPFRIGPHASGIVPLTADTLAEAINCGTSTTVSCEPRVAPCASVNTLDVLIMSPFRSAMLLATSAKRDDKHMPKPILATLNRAVELHIDSIRELRGAQVVTGATIVRDGVTIRPAYQQLDPQVLQNAFGATVRAQDGVFGFPVSAFAPTADLTIRVTTESGPITCDIIKAELASLR